VVPVSTTEHRRDPVEVERLKTAAIAVVDRLGPWLIEISHDIWDHPELCFAEHHASGVLCDALEAEGLHPERPAFGLDTAFVARAGTTGAEVGVLCEYDALPGIGHACGHNVIAAAGLGAGLAAASVAEEAGGRVRILGTPAEEGGGGKVLMQRQGAFRGLAAAMMVHPADRDLPVMRCIAVQRLSVEYHGEAAHAAAAPHLGRNALDAAVLGYLNVAALRQHIRPEERVHGIFTDAGEQPNVVPRHAAAEWYVRASDLASLEELEARVLAALAAGAAASGCEMTHHWHDPAYADMVDDADLLACYEANAARFGRISEDPELDGAVVGSTDMGNVSHEVPSIHPMVAVAPRGVGIHTAEFARHARGPGGDAAVLDAAKAMACTTVDLWCTSTAGAAVPAGEGGHH
jgi:amidohydrolase